MAKRFFNTSRIDEDWYLELSLKHRELLRFCESKCDGAGVFCFSGKIASLYIGEKVTEADLEKIGAEKLSNGKFWLPAFIEEQNSELKENCPAHKPIFKSIKENGLTLSNRVSERVFNTQQEIEKEVVIEKDKEIEEETDKEKDLRKKMREVFVEVHNRKKGIDYYWSTPDAVGIKNVVPKIKITAKARDGDEETVLQFWRTLLDNLPDWYFQNGFTPPIINKKFNEIVSKIHKPNATNHANLDAKIAEHLAAHRAHVAGAGG